ncbi:unnamed protein product [Musa textilis]
MLVLGTIRGASKINLADSSRDCDALAASGERHVLYHLYWPRKQQCSSSQVGCAKDSYLSSYFQLQFFVSFCRPETAKTAREKACSFVLIAYSKEDLSDTSTL